MPESHLQNEFLRVFADGHKATSRRIISQLMAVGVPSELVGQITKIVHEEVRGLYHGNLVVFDGGSSLADHGLIKIIDDTGTQFNGNLHEIGFRFYDDNDDGGGARGPR